ncbi:hypothetical protein KP509_02G028400 [Ceratopteris richardii]|uniref:DNA mismatch repair protein MSH4 n=1 Tax=Ceratopteris richardii TaxID=49495 RepID=A0A8T2V7B9_CERRI|nr:hypothetical protein KP509_02G028400 [Ceratopteris richardii]
MKTDHFQQIRQEDPSVPSSHIAVAIIENRAKEVGLAAFDTRTASLHLSQFIETSRSYTNTSTLLHYFDPVEIIVPPSNSNPQGLAGAFGALNLVKAQKIVLARGCFDDTKGAIMVKNLAAKEPAAFGLDGYFKRFYLCLGAAAAVIRWVENERGVMVIHHSLQVTFNGSADHMGIDSTSVQNLEIIESLAVASGVLNKKCSSLFRMLNTTKTFGGSRLLRANLLQPLKDARTINMRLDCLEELTSNEELFFGLSKVLSKFPKDIDRVLCHFCFRQKKTIGNVADSSSTKRSQTLIASVILLKQAVEVLPALAEILNSGKSQLLTDIRDSICHHAKFKALRERIIGVIDDDVLHAKAPFVARTQQCFAVKPGIDGLLDMARKAFCETSEAIHILAKNYREIFNLPNLKMPFNSKRGFYISIAETDIHEEGLPKLFFQVTKQGKNIHCSTQELISLNVRNKEAATECYHRTEICLEGLIDKIREDVTLLTLLSESISLLDMIVNSFASVVVSKEVGSYIRPEFTEDGPIALEAGRHPLVEVLRSEQFVPNNAFLSEASNMVLIIGPNMSGKSTYLRQVALITVMAHVGCFVPAQFASFRVVDRILTRIGSGDSPEFNSSTFMTEMKETTFLLENVTPRSLILIDELGRATSSVDGLAVAWSCCEYLLSTNAYTIFSTHMHKLVELSSLYPNVKVCHFLVNITNGKLDFKFSLKEGYFSIPHYGLLLSELAGFPQNVIEDAKKLTEKLKDKDSIFCFLLSRVGFEKRMMKSQSCKTFSKIQTRWSVLFVCILLHVNVC